MSKLSEIDRRIETEQARPLDGRDRPALERLYAERGAVEESLRLVVARMERGFPQYAALKYPKPCRLDEARACLAVDEVALLYATGWEASYLIVLKKGPDEGSAGIEVHPLPGAEQIAEQVASLTQAKTLDDPEATLEIGAGLYRMLIAPAVGSIEGRHLVIAPGGVLGSLPFELLAEPDGAGGGRFLVERHRIRYAPSLTALHFVGLWERVRPPAERTLWAMGDPAYDPSAPPAAIARLARGAGAGVFRRLPYSGVEVERLRQEMGADRGDILTGAAANEATLKSLSASGELAKYRFVHLSCHGVLGLADGTPPGLVLSQSGDLKGEDGYLRLGEVADLKLNADLVVLSACQTGQGEQYRAEGVGSLGRAFLHAGSRGVLCSLWQVDDEATADLMADLYANLKAGQSSADALRSAQLKRIEAGDPPLHWAPFVLIGR